MAKSYPGAIFLQDFQVLGEQSSQETISAHMAGCCADEKLARRRFNVFCKTILVLDGFKKDHEFRSFIDSHPGTTEPEILKAVVKAIHVLVVRNIDENLSYQPSWDEVGLTARLYLHW